MTPEEYNALSAAEKKRMLEEMSPADIDQFLRPLAQLDNATKTPQILPPPLPLKIQKKVYLKYCPACKNIVSSEAGSCPQCGHPINLKNNAAHHVKDMRMRLIGISAAIALFTLAAMVKGCDN